MCGIAGIISTNPHNVSRQRLQAMTDSIAHRGPESDGFWINKTHNVGFGHRRLSIIDLSESGAQPMHYAGRYTITYNGEIYNYVEVKKQLLSKGYQFTSSCDTEVVLAAYACYGKNCLDYFDGMFAFAIWDEEEQTLFCARDRFGEKPFYYSHDENGFLFASEMKALWAAGTPRHADSSMLLNYLTIGYTNDPTDLSRTFFKNIGSLPAAHYFECRLSVTNSGLGFAVIPYWHLDKETRTNINENDAIEKFSELFQTSVKRRLRSDVAIGTSLSGGLDSSSIVATIHALLGGGNYSQSAFSAIFPGFDKDESKQVALVAEKFKLNSYAVSPTGDELVNDLEKLFYHQEEPFQSSSIYAQYKVYELAKQYGVTVLLDGQGADETLAGYHQYYHWYWQELILRSKFKKQKAEQQKAKEMGVDVSWGWKNYLAAYLPALTAQQLEKRVSRQQRRHPDINSDFFMANADRMSVYKPVTDKLNDILYFNTMQTGLVELLRYADRNSMAHSREVRLPFLNHELVQFIFSLPSHFKIKDGWTKWILRQSMSYVLPNEITWRTDKVGFEPPQQLWMQQPAMIENIYESRRKLVKQGILRSSVLQKPIDKQSAHAAGNFDWRYLCAAQCF